MTTEAQESSHDVPSGFGCYTYALKNYAKFTGRARRREYWMFVLFNLIISFVLGFIDGVIGTFDVESGVGVLGGLYSLLVLIPSLAISVRRLHDIGKTGWWLLILLIPIIGALVILIFFLLDSKEEGAKYGPARK